MSSLPLTIIKRTTDLLIPRSCRKEPPSSSPEAARPPSPLLEPPSLYVAPSPLLGPFPSSSSRRSVVTHAVLGSEAAGLHSLPHELLCSIFLRLDACSLCRLAQVSTSCTTLADDPLVWTRSPAGHCKEESRGG